MKINSSRGQLFIILWLLSSNYKARSLCLSVCPSHTPRTFHPVYFTLGGCIAVDRLSTLWVLATWNALYTVNAVHLHSSSGLLCVKFGAISTHNTFNIYKLWMNNEARSSSGGWASQMSQAATETHVWKLPPLSVFQHLYVWPPMLDILMVQPNSSSLPWNQRARVNSLQEQHHTNL